MQDIQGIYDNGKIELEGAAPMKRAKVIVVFTEAEPMDNKASIEDDLRIFRKYSGSIKREVDFEKERDEYLQKRGMCIAIP